jgi:hypothetical protein
MTKNIIQTPTRLFLPKTLQKGIAQFVAGAAHTLFLCSQTGFVYQCGGSHSQQHNLFHKVLINEPIRSIEASLFSAAISYNNILYLWSDKDTFNPSYSLTNISSIALGKRFAVLLDSTQRAYEWGSLTDPLPVPFYEITGPVEVSNLKSKTIKSAYCGQDFVIALGKDKKQPAQPQNRVVSKQRSVSAPK